MGGPSAETNPEKAKQNLIAEDGRVNKSYIGSVEGYIRDELKAGKEVYCQADVKYKTDPATGEKKPDTVTYRFFGNEGGKPKELLGNGITTNVDIRPSQTMGEALKPTDAKKNADFYKPDQLGTVGGIN